MSQQPETKPSGGWPLAWDSQTSGSTDDQPAGDTPVRWPSLGQLTYTKEAITVLLLLLALPWLLSKLLTRPGDVLQGLGQRAAGKAVI